MGSLLPIFPSLPHPLIPLHQCPQNINMLPQHPCATILQRLRLLTPLLLLATATVDDGTVGEEVVGRDDAKGRDFAVLHLTQGGMGSVCLLGGWGNEACVIWKEYGCS